ncbi:MAG: helix-turn-helix domain-containing protein [Streptosporangiales bacterium]|nr:helix-turn-helix domain-containing protein [Streptosporangiales bacterium]
MARTGRPAVRHIEAVQRAVTVLDVLGDGGELGTNEIARRSGVNVSSVSRLLATLTEGGLVQHVPSTGRYRLGVRVLQLANAVRGHLDIRGLARPYLEELTGITGETATLSLPGEHDVLTVDYAQGDQSVRSIATVGRNSVAHATSVGKVFLAWGGRLPKGRLAAYTEQTITARGTLDAEIAEVRERGWAVAVREREDDLTGLAAPVVDSGGRLVAILGIQGPSTRFTRQAVRAAVDPLLSRASTLGSVV